MAQRLVVLSDMWGIRNGLWVTSYLGYLQQYYDIVYYDCQELAQINVENETEENLHNAFVSGGIDIAVSELLKKEKKSEPSRYLAFSIGGTIAYKAGLAGLPIKSLYAVSSTRVRKETEKPSFDTRFIYGANDKFRPSDEWATNLDLEIEVIDDFGHELYSDEKITKEICQEFLTMVSMRKCKASA
ncbi:hypothetical protein KO500_01900 [Cellulophaga baltica]|uniref:hypothetical protein n=1 Tax=Cellulophaga TaxID=104264 RepID=UPI001C06E5EE|nr:MULTISPECIES: hypothetical protein [Cellulophaga]MBU2995164.1 hypothetical protein [Cellulophaga baltica]MDO6766559.1 hypothetical protein [Cellulophaga sp. 1_MG-2023]